LLADQVLSRSALDQIDENIIEAYKQRRTKWISRRGRPLSVASINRELATLRRLLRMAQEWKILARVPRIRLLRGEHGREFTVSYAHEALYLGATTGDLHDVALLMLDTGLRMGEVLTLSVSDVQLQPANGARYGYLTVRPRKSKNSKGRNVPLTSRVSKMLSDRSRIGDSGLVFRREDNRPLAQTWLNEQHREIYASLQLGPEFVPHSLRHTFGTRLGEAGADAFTIMRLMGHSSVTVSQRYVHPSPESVENAIARMESLGQQKKSEVGVLFGIPKATNERPRK
jgi:integrase